jgi:transcriptional regulator with XRE-family HTH domain
MSTVSDRIRQARAAKDLTQQQLADLTQVSLKAAQNWEAGATPRDPMLEKIASVLDVTVDHLRGDETVEENILTVLNKAKAKIAEALNVSVERIDLKVSFAA